MRISDWSSDVCSSDLFANSPDPLALILRGINQPVVATILAVSAVVALPTVLLGFLFGQSRIFFTMARDGLLPAKLATVSKRGAPVKITILRSEEHTSALQSLMRNSYAVFCLTKKTTRSLTNILP